MKNPFLYTPQTDGGSCSLIKENSHSSHYSIGFPSAFTPVLLDNTRVTGEYIFPAGKKKASLVVLVHGMGDSSVIPCRLISKTLAKQGIASFIIYLVFHNKRGSQVIKNKYPSLSAEEWFESYQLSVIDIRQVIDWAYNRPEIEHENIAVAGISFGGMISTIAMSLDNRIKAGIFIVSGGNSSKMTRYSALLRLKYKISEAQYRKEQEEYAGYLSEVAARGFENVDPGKSAYLTDPMTYSYGIKSRPVMMLNALFDEMIPRASTLDLWKALEKPPLSWFPATHASIWAWYPIMAPKIGKFFDNYINGRSQAR